MSQTLFRSSKGTIASALVFAVLAGQTGAHGENGAGLDAPEIARIAPERALAVISIPDWPALHQAVMKGNLGRLWEEPAVAKLITDMTKDRLEGLTSFLATIDADLEDLKQPTGHVGAAFFLPEAGEGEEAASDEPYFMMVADFGEHAAHWQKLIGNYIDRGLDNRTLTTDDDVYQDIKITIIKPVYLEDPHANCGDECKHEPGMEEWIGGSFEDQRQVNIVQVGQSLVICNHLPSLELAIDRMTGRGRDALADSDAYRDAVARFERGAVAHAVFQASPMLNLMLQDLEDEPRQMLEILGISAMRGAGAALRLDGPDAVAEVDMSLLLSDKRGLFELLDESGGAFEPPSFVPPGAASVSRFSFRFGEVLRTARRAIGSLPAEEREQAMMMLDQSSGILGPLLDVMGPAVHAMTIYRQPFAADSAQGLYAIDVREEMTVTNTLDFLVGQAGGMIETREFAGTVIYFSEMLPIELAAAVGFGRLFIGPPAAVENALRAAAQADAPRLADEARFREATRPLAASAVMFSYTDVSQWLRWMWWSTENAEKILEQTLDKAAIDDEYRAEIMRSMLENKPEWQKKLPPVESITRHLGDVVYELRSVDGGYSGRLLLLKPRDR